MSAAASSEAVAAKLREMGMSADEAARVAGGQTETREPGRANRRSPTTLSEEHREAIAQGRRRQIAARAAEVPEPARAPRFEPVIIPPLPLRRPLCPAFGIVARPGLHGVSVARVACVDGARA